jgi:dihydrofolate synthase/folylpolyglutamate synthase
MTYQEASAWLADAAKYKISLGLDSERSLLHYLGDPQEELTFVHIAGTNGKGSVLAYLASILTEAGYRTGTYSSPAVVEELETIRIDQEMISEEAYAAVLTQVAEAAGKMVQSGEKHPTKFELETAAAVLYFREQQCDYVVLETGMGGRLDATNVMTRVPVGILTSVSMDHRAFLGDTLEIIASEKAGIIKDGMDVVYLEQDPAVNAVIQNKINEMEAAGYPVRSGDICYEQESLTGQTFSWRTYENLELSMTGVVQPVNAALAVQAALCLQEKGAEISDSAIRSGLKQMQWPGRFQILSGQPLILADGAHNPDAVRCLAESVKRYIPDRRLICIMGVFADKDYKTMCSIMGPLADMVITTTPPNRERALPAASLAECMREYCSHTEAAGSLEEALSKAIEKAEMYAGDTGAILAFGSLSYLGDFLRLNREREGIRE